MYKVCILLALYIGISQRTVPKM